MLNNWLRSIQFQPHGICLLCGGDAQVGLDLCAACQADLPWLTHMCPRCALPIPSGYHGPCGDCLQTPPPQERSLAALRYETPLPFLITGLKFQAHLAHARLLGQLLVEAIRQQTRTHWPETLIPVPLHPSRLRERGFNQAQEIARSLSKLLSIPMDTHACVRRRATSPQSELDAKARQRNLRRAFAVPQALGYRHVAIIDDVMTTGSTAIEMTNTLKQAGVTCVEVWTAARAVKY